MSKEPGEMVFDVMRYQADLLGFPYYDDSWEFCDKRNKEALAAVEATIRADEAAKVRAECAVDFDAILKRYPILPSVRVEIINQFRAKGAEHG